MKWNDLRQAYDVYVNGTMIKHTYSKSKAINIAQMRCGQLFENRKTEVVDSITGEVIYQLN